MTLLATPALTSPAPTVLLEAPHRHDSACYWDVIECHWQCVPYPLVRYALEHCTAIGRRAADTAAKTRP
jgi:hypothetical protein